MSKEDILQAKDKSVAHLKKIHGDDAETLIADARYGFISGLLNETLRKPATEKISFSDRVDKILLNRVAGIPIFLALLYGVFQFAFILSDPLMDWIDAGFSWLGERSVDISPEWIGSLIGDGVIAGVGTVLSFVPPIFLLFIAIAVLEDSGYMARAAFVVDRVMHRVGLHGRSFIPMVLGFGCNVPAIMATRTIENPRDRLTTILINPLMSCGGRLPIYMLLAGAFFSAYQSIVVFSFYLIGMILALIVALLLRKSVLAGPSAHFVMELPPYRLPTIRGIVIHTWERGKEFLIRAGTIIFVIVVLIWLLDYSGSLEFIGRGLAPIFSPCGFGDWQAATALIFGFFAKEAVVGTFGTLFAVEGAGIADSLEALGWTPLVVYAFMAFCLIYVPCAATVAIIRRETHSWRWTVFAIGYTIVLGWIVATLIYQVGMLIIG